MFNCLFYRKLLEPYKKTQSQTSLVKFLIHAICVCSCMYISNVRTVNFIIQTKSIRLVSDFNQAACF